MRGGARAASGPAPDPDALRRGRCHDPATWTALPAEGRQGEAPEFPLASPTTRELDVWASEWRRPQAVEWERNGQHAEVAFYVRSFVEAETRPSPTAVRLVASFRSTLGLTPTAMLRHRWRITRDES